MSVIAALGQSLFSLAAGYIPAVILGLPLGLLIGCHPILCQIGKRLLQFPIVAPIVYVTLFLTIIQSNQPVPILTTLFSSLWFIAIYTGIGLQRAFQNGNQFALAVPKIFLGLRLGLTFAWVALLTAEATISGAAGLGFYLWDAYLNAYYPNVFLGIIIIVLITFITDQLLDVLGIIIKNALKRPA